MSDLVVFVLLFACRGLTTAGKPPGAFVQRQCARPTFETVRWPQQALACDCRKADASADKRFLAHFNTDVHQCDRFGLERAVGAGQACTHLGLWHGHDAPVVTVYTWPAATQGGEKHACVGNGFDHAVAHSSPAIGGQALATTACCFASLC